ncbi:hypothetical protein FOCC_FOCC011729 [Frankliniella occidentalis]|uniref:Uncharacterized protein LOC113204765 n=1 Tax=Frankliniella occidentalis TaxID=133901 RepID=A0A6J1SAW5_FRAOC|nr:uncharacterized protein LOC113204765 [Frankliniella occidentalis]KAE8742696.1 hypothetical protein FOCC_FOCC011729 [Frankliniella occidentalis]
MDWNEFIRNDLERGVLQNVPSSSSSSSSSSEARSDSSDSSLEDAILLDSNSESEDERDELAQLFAGYANIQFGAPRSRVDNFLEIVREKSDEEFRSDFRLYRPVAYELIASLDASGVLPNHLFGKEKKSAEFSFLLFLWFVSCGSILRDIANTFGCGTSTVFRVVRRVTEWLTTISNEHIIWPRGGNIEQTAAAFARAGANIRNCIGAIDGSHIFIEKPPEYGVVYWCRKERYSIVLQAVVDFDKLFTNVHCGDPGSYHDTRVLRRSELYNIAERNLEYLFPNGTFLLGDKGYAGVGKKWIVTPFKDYGNQTAEQADFNTRVSTTRVVVEQAFGILKNRFRYLRGIMPLRDVQFAAQLVVACCVLHNICIRSNDYGEDFREDAEDEDDNESEGEGEGEHDDNAPVNIPDNRTLEVFRQMYPGAAEPANRRVRNND